MVLAVAGMGLLLTSDPGLSRAAAKEPVRLEKLTPQGQEAFQQLLTADAFEHVNVGYGGVLSDGVKAFRLLLWQPGADGAFKQLIARGRPAGQLYGLCGVYFTDHAYFVEAAERFRGITTPVPFQDGCIEMKTPVGKIVFSPEPNVIRLKWPEASLESWQRRVKQGDFSEDISGRALPIVLRGKAK